jgi:hypothetical protein
MIRKFNLSFCVLAISSIFTRMGGRKKEIAAGLRALLAGGYPENEFL